MVDDDARPDAGGAVTEPGFRDLLEKLSTTYGFDFREYKEASLARRIRARMSQVHVGDFAEYARYLDVHAGEHVALFNTILINVTAFFRDPEAWKVLAAEVIPRLVEGAGRARSIRIWSAGCSTGEEVYTTAMVLAEHLGERQDEYVVKIYGTDVDEDALAVARHAAYRMDQLKDVPDALLDRYFARDGQLYRFRREYRRWCIFGAHNLVQAPPLSHIDLLVCRNVLIYFTSDLQQRILGRFHYALRDDGYLFLGRSESVLARSRWFQPVQVKWRIFRRSATTGRAAAETATQVRPVTPAPEDRQDAPHASVRTQRALEALPVAVMVIDMTDTVLVWNPAAERLFDIPAGNAVGRVFRDLDVSYRVEALRARIEDVKARHGATRLDEATFTRRNGELVHADITIAPLTDASRLIGVVVVALDATDQARLKEQMTRIAEQHATAIEELQSTNEELETTNEELQSTNEELETTNEELQSTNEELETTIEELQAANAELSTVNAELESRTAELHRLDGHHQSLINGLEQGMVAVDGGLVVRTWNRAAERMWGVRAEHVVGRELNALSVTDVARTAQPAFHRVLSTGTTEEVRDLAYALPGGQTHHTVLQLSALRDGRGAIVGVLGVFSPDATPRR